MVGRVADERALPKRDLTCYSAATGFAAIRKAAQVSMILQVAYEQIDGRHRPEGEP
jgi:hypothetical protein